MKTIRAIYEHGVFRPTEQVELPEFSVVEFEPRPVTESEQGPVIHPPSVTDPAERARIMERLLESMRSNPIPAGAPHFTRDELHERR